MEVIKLIFIVKKTMEQLEKAMLKINNNKLIPGTVDFGVLKSKKTGKEKFYYVAKAEI